MSRSFLSAAVWLLCTLLLTPGCELCKRAPEVFLAADWEDCEGTCGWNVQGGEARIVSTVHPAEHGLAFDGEHISAHLELKVPLGDGDPLEVDLVTSCPASFLLLKLSWTNAPVEEVSLTGSCDRDRQSFCALHGRVLTDRSQATNLAGVDLEIARSCTLDRLLIYAGGDEGC